MEACTPKHNDTMDHAIMTYMMERNGRNRQQYCGLNIMDRPAQMNSETLGASSLSDVLDGRNVKAGGRRPSL